MGETKFARQLLDETPQEVKDKVSKYANDLINNMSKEHYRPLPDNVTIDEAKWLSEITGKRQLGLFATDVMYQDEIIGLTHIKEDSGCFDNDLIRTPLGGFFNHSETPNCELVDKDGYYYLKTMRDIYAGEEITCKYKLYDPTK